VAKTGSSHVFPAADRVTDAGLLACTDSAASAIDLVAEGAGFKLIDSGPVLGRAHCAMCVCDLRTETLPETCSSGLDGVCVPGTCPTGFKFDGLPHDDILEYLWLKY
jgi:hypothetical protein